jgi:hypothetical protein
MYDLDGAQFERGEFEIRLEKRAPQPLAAVLSLGPIRGRLVALSLILLSAAMVFSDQPTSWLQNLGVLPQGVLPQTYQGYFTWPVLAVGAVLWLSHFLFRKPRLTLIFDRSSSELRYSLEGLFAKSLPKEALVPFRNIQEIRVHAADSAASPFGWIELKLLASSPLNSVCFRVLSAEQASIFPLNLSRVVGKEPVGAWVDPDSIPRS